MLATFDTPPDTTVFPALLRCFATHTSTRITIWRSRIRPTTFNEDVTVIVSEVGTPVDRTPGTAHGRRRALSGRMLRGGHRAPARSIAIRLLDMLVHRPRPQLEPSPRVPPHPEPALDLVLQPDLAGREHLD